MFVSSEVFTAKAQGRKEGAKGNTLCLCFCGKLD